MPRLDTSARAKSLEPTRSTEPHLIKLPNTPAAVIHSNPLESHSSKASSDKDKGKENNGVKHDSKSSSAPPSSPPTSRGPAVTSAATSAAASTTLNEITETSGDADIIDMETFEQILDMDDGDETHEFSLGIVENYFEQAKETFDKMDLALKKKDLEQLSQLGHFLKGSSAALGVQKVQATCEYMQNYGKLRDEDAKGPKKSLTPEEALKKIAVLTGRVRGEYGQAEKWLKDYFANL